MKTAILALLLATSSYATVWTIIDHNSNTSGVTTMNTTGANFLQTAAACNAGGVPTIADSVGGNSNVWSTAVSNSPATLYLFTSIPTHIGASHVITVTGNGCTALATASMAWNTTVGTTSLELSNNAELSSTTSIQPGSITPTHNDVLVISAVQFDSGTTPVSGFSPMTLIEQDGKGATQGIALAYYIMATPSAINPNWSATASSPSFMGSVIASFLGPTATATTSQTVGNGIVGAGFSR